MQSDLLEKMVVPEGVNPENVTEKEAYKIPPIKLRYKEGMTFKQFNDVTIEMYSTQKKKKKSEWLHPFSLFIALNFQTIIQNILIAA